MTFALLQEDARARLLRLAEAFKESVLEVQLQAATRPELLEALAGRGWGGREYVEAVRERRDVLLLALPLP